jgi:tRNA pseudouridine38-40 synthase
MPRYFLELSYKGTNYSGFQVQKNANTIQSEVEKALQTLYRQQFVLTGSSRTDAGVHALQNFFHFDTGLVLKPQSLYNLNAILPADIAVSALYNVQGDAHSRFAALSREYKYLLYQNKNTFLYDRAWHYPFRIDKDLLHKAAELTKGQTNFIAFSKRNTQVNNFNCIIQHSQWKWEGECLVYNVKANRFLRGMVRALVASMLKVARGICSLDEFESLFNDAGQSSASFAAPAHGLYLIQVEYPQNYLHKIE